MNIQDYLSRYANHRQLTLVGPLTGTVLPYEEPVIFVDGGARFREKSQGVTVGDGDSYGGPLDQRLNPHKDFSDLAYVLRQVPAHFTRFRLHGFLGGRRDHELFNLGEANHLLCTREQPTTLSFDSGILGFSKGSWQLDIADLFSIAVLRSTRVRLTGDCRYQCADWTQFEPLSSLGLSNRGFGAVQLECDGPVFVLFDGQARDQASQNT